MLWKDKKSSLRLDFAVSEWPCTRKNEILCAPKIIFKIKVHIHVKFADMIGIECNVTKEI